MKSRWTMGLLVLLLGISPFAMSEPSAITAKPQEGSKEAWDKDLEPQKGFKEAWEKVANLELKGIGPNYEDALWQLVSQSEFKKHYIHGKFFYVITPHYSMQSGIEYLRGASGNGFFYVFDRHLKFVGSLRGKSYEFLMREDGTIAILTTWHTSATDDNPKLHILKYEDSIWKLVGPIVE